MIYTKDIMRDNGLYVIDAPLNYTLMHEDKIQWTSGFNCTFLFIDETDFFTVIHWN